jgi:hypothetical protein
VGRTPVHIGVEGGHLVAKWKNLNSNDYGLNIWPVSEPKYYAKFTKAGRPVKRMISACGYDEMNIWPWHDCAISRACKFCGINGVNKRYGSDNIDPVYSRSKKMTDNNVLEMLNEIRESSRIAESDEIYKEHLHLIIISGNLPNDKLDYQADLYSKIAINIPDYIKNRANEGIVAVTAPSSRYGLMSMKQSGISIIVQNLEVWDPDVFSLVCPGKSDIGRDFYIDAQVEAEKIFGFGKSWCNFILGIEPISSLLDGCLELSIAGITPGANIYHIDHGSAGKWSPPLPEEAIEFFNELSSIYKKYSMAPFYCQKALRTSLSNEAFHGRLV